MNPRKVVSIPNGIDTRTFRPPSHVERDTARRSLRLSTNSVVVLYLGRLVPFKRVDLLIDAWQRLGSNEGRQLLIVGQGSMEGTLRERAAELGVAARFDGPTDDAALYLRAADVFVLPSGDHKRQEYEGLSVALLEAMAVGLAPIVTRGPGNDVLVPDDSLGLRFPIGDSDALARCLELALSSPTLRESIGRNAHERVYHEYAAEAVARQMTELYSQVAPADRPWHGGTP